MQEGNKRNSIGMLGINVCFSILSMFVSLFLIARIFIITGNDFVAVGLFTLVEITALMFAYLLASVLCKRIKAINVTRLAAVVACGFLFLTVFWSDGLYNYYLIFAGIWGVALGLFWGGNNLLVAAVFKKEKTVNYMVWAHSLNTVTKILFPITFGLAIDYGSFLVTCIVVLIISIIQIIFAALIKTSEQPKSRLQMIKFFKRLKEKKFTRPAWSFCIITICNGLAHTTALCITIMIIFIHGTYTSLGFFSSIFGIASIVVLLLYNRMGNHKGKLYIVATIAPVLASFLLFGGVIAVTVFIFQMVNSSFRRVLAVEEESTRLSMAKYWGGEEFTTESHMFYEFMLWVGRAISCSIIILLGIFMATEIFFVMAVIFMVVACALHGLLLLFWKKKYISALHKQ